MSLARAFSFPSLALVGLVLLLGAAPEAWAEPPAPVRVETIVPDVTGLAEAAAVAGLEAIYRLEVVEVASSLADHGRVVAQRPGAGQRLLFRGRLRLEVGRVGLVAADLELPSLVGLDLAEAERVLLDQGLVPVPVFRHAVSRGRPFGGLEGRRNRPEIGMRSSERVVRQDPASGAHVAAQARVVLHVTLPRVLPHRLRVPSLQGLTSTQAAEALRTLGLTPRIRRVPSVFPEETVVEQIPATGARLRGGSVVQLVVAYPARSTHVPAQVQVPDLRAARLSEAYELARAAGVRLQIRRRLDPEQPVDQVRGQRPTPGVRVPLGTVLRISLPLATDVPSLLGLRPDEAARRAEEAGLALVFEGDSRRGHRARVVDQSPTARQAVAVGTAVRAVLRGRPKGQGGLVPPPERTLKVRVPDLRGMTLADAARRLAQAGLVARPSVVRGGGLPVVTGQSLAPGAVVPRGTEVHFTVRR